jgi:tetratricopeptide (TPR) repeat protein
MRINKRFVLMSMVVGLVAVGTLFGVHRLQEERIARALLWQADAAREKDNPEDEVKYLTRYLEFVPRDAQNVLRLANLLKRQAKTYRQLLRVQSLYETALRLSPEQIEARKDAVEVSLLVGRYADALAHLDVLRQHIPNDPYVHDQSGYCYTALGKYEDAQRSLTKAIELDPNLVRAYDLLAYVLRRHLNRPEEGRSLVDALVSSNPLVAEAYLVRARYLRELKINADIRADLDKTLELDPLNDEAMLLAAEYAQTQGRIDVARQLLQTVCDLYVEDVRGYRALSWIELWLGDRQAGINWLKKGLERMPEQVELLATYGDLLAEEGDVHQLKQVISRMQKAHAPRSAIDYLNLRVVMCQEKWPEALAGLNRLRTEVIDQPNFTVQIDTLLADVHNRLGDREQAMNCLRRAYSTDPNSVVVRAKLASVYVQLGMVDDAIREYRALLQMPYAPSDVRVNLARLIITRRRDLLTGEGNLRELQDLIAHASTDPRWLEESKLLESQLLVSRHRHADARAILEKATHDAPHVPKLWLALVTVVEQIEGPEAGLRILDQAVEKCGDRPEFRVRRVSLQLQNPDNTRELIVASALSGAEKFSLDERNRLLSSLGELFMRDGDLSIAQRCFAAVLNNTPTHADSLRGQFDLALRRNDLDLANNTLKQVEKLHGTESQQYAMMDARRWIYLASKDSANLPRASAVVRDLVKQYPNNALALFLHGRVHELQGDALGAIAQYRLALNANAGDIASFERVLMLYRNLRRASQAEQLLSLAAKQAIIPPDNLKAAVEMLAADLSESALVRICRILVPAQSHNIRDRLWVARLLASRGKYQDAIEECRQLLKTNSHSGQVWVALIRYYGQIGDTDRAMQAIEQMKEAIPPARLAGVLGDCYEALQLDDRLVEQGLAAVRDGTADLNTLRRTVRALINLNRKPEAVRLLEQTINTQSHAITAQERAWARRNLALLLGSEASVQARRRALALLDANLNELRDSAEDQRARAVILSNVLGLNEAQRREALTQSVSILESLAGRGNATARDRFDLARLYTLNRQYDRARPILEKLLQEDPRNTAVLAFHVNELLVRDELAAATEWIKTMEEIQPPDLATTRTLARYYALKGDFKRTLQTLDELTARIPAGQSAGLMAKREQVGKLYEEFARLSLGVVPPKQNRFAQRAAELYKQCPRRPVHTPTRFAYLASLDGRPDEAIAILKANREQMTLPALVDAGMTVLGHRQAQPAQINQVKAWLDEALKAEPKSQQLLLSLAEFQHLQQDYDAAERTYREVLALNPNQVVALNNLAWLLGQRGQKLDEARRLVNRAIELVGHQGELLDTRARVLIASREYAPALDDLQQALSEAQTATRFFTAAVAHYRNDDRLAAIRAFRRARQLGLRPQLIDPLEQEDYQTLLKVAG